MKRGAQTNGKAAKRPKAPVPEYCDTAAHRDDQNRILWPADAGQIEAARGFIREWLVPLILRVFLLRADQF